MLCGGTDTSGTEPDHALWWKRDVNLHWRVQDVRMVYKALPKDVQRQSVESRLTASLDEHWTSPDVSLSGCPRGPGGAAYGNMLVVSLESVDSSLCLVVRCAVIPRGQQEDVEAGNRHRRRLPG